MRLPLMPTRIALWALAGVVLAALAAPALAPQLTIQTAGRFAAGAVLVWVLVDIGRSVFAWFRKPLQWHRRLPAALALGVPRTVACSLVNEGPDDWWIELIDRVDPHLDVQGLPLQIYVPAHSRIELHYSVVPRRRGRARFAPVELRVRTLHGTFEWVRRIGETQTLHVHPDFAAVSRFAWLAKDGRLADVGVRRRPQRGRGSDFERLRAYQPGESTRLIDWKATLKRHRPVVRQLQAERGQCLLFLLDCGGRMQEKSGAGRFDEALNALVLLAHVALQQGDEVGAMSFGTDVSQRRLVAPRKGPRALSGLMATLHDLQPQAATSDYRVAARELMQVRHKRALVVVLSRFRDEDAGELQQALALLRSRHLVVLNDMEPSRFATELVNRYIAIKQAGLL
jgi:uncharacterized protein (DUF58 family)